MCVGRWMCAFSGLMTTASQPYAAGGALRYDSEESVESAEINRHGGWPFHWPLLPDMDASSCFMALINLWQRFIATHA